MVNYAKNLCLKRVNFEQVEKIRICKKFQKRRKGTEFPRIKLREYSIFQTVFDLI